MRCVCGVCYVWRHLLVYFSVRKKNKRKKKEKTLCDDKMTRGGNVLKYLLFICICLIAINEQCIISKLPMSDSLHVVNYTQR